MQGGQGMRWTSQDKEFCPEDRKDIGGLINRKNVRSASYIAAFCNSTKAAMDPGDKVEIYGGREPRELPFCQRFDNRYDQFEYRYEDLFSREYSFFRPVISHTLLKFLDCGDFEQGVGVSLRSLSCPGMLPRLSP